MGENILLAIDPQIWESFLCRVKDLGEVAKASLLIEHLVGLAELLTISPCSAVRLEYLAQTLNLIQETFAGSLTIFRVQVILFVRPLF